jgi:hypothetical protein
MAPAGSRQLPTATARVQSQVRACGICGEESGTAECFLRVFRFPLSIIIPLTAPYSPTIRSWYNKPTNCRRTKQN